MVAGAGGSLRHRSTQEEDGEAKKQGTKTQIPSEQNLRNSMQGAGAYERDDEAKPQKQPDEPWHRQMLIHVLIAADVWLIPSMLLLVLGYVLFLRFGAS